MADDPYLQLGTPVEDKSDPYLALGTPTATGSQVESAIKREQMGDVDQSTGASTKARLAAALAHKPEDVLATVQKYHPGAIVRTIGGEQAPRHGIPVSGGQQEHVILIPHPDPQGSGKQWAVLDPEGFFNSLNPANWDWGDFAEAGPVLAEVSASIPAYIGVTALTGGNSAAGLAAGVAAGEAVRLALREIAAPYLDVEETRGFWEKLGDDAMQMGSEGVMGVAGLWGVGKGGRVLSETQRARAGAGMAAKKWKPVGFGDKQAYDDLEALGAKPLANQVNTSPTLQDYFQALRKYPEASDHMAKAIKDTWSKVSDRALNTLKRMSGVESLDDAGESLRKGFMYRTDKAIERQDILEGKLAKEYGLGEQVDLNQFFDNFKKRWDAWEDWPNWRKSKFPRELSGYMEDAEKNGGVVSFDMARDMRQIIGREFDNASTHGKPMAAEWGEMYGAFSDALGEAAKKRSPAAYHAFKKTQEHWKHYKGLMAKVSRVADAKSTINAFKNASTNIKQSAELLGNIKKAIPKEYWDDFVAAKIREISVVVEKETGEEIFDPARFFNTWSKYPEKVRDLMVPKSNPLRAEWDRISRVGGRKSASQRYENFSNTTAAATATRHIEAGGLFGFVRTTGRVAVGVATAGTSEAMRWAGKHGGLWTARRRAIGQAKLMTNPKFVRWLADGQAIDPGNVQAVANHMGALTGIGGGREVQEYIEEFAAIHQSGTEKK